MITVKAGSKKQFKIIFEAQKQIIGKCYNASTNQFIANVNNFEFFDDVIEFTKNDIKSFEKIMGIKMSGDKAPALKVCPEDLQTFYSFQKNWVTPTSSLFDKDYIDLVNDDDVRQDTFLD